MYACPKCSGDLKFDIKSQMLLCNYCDMTINPYDVCKEKDAEENVIDNGEYEVTIFTCPQCGGELISDETTAATFCSYCGASTILDSRIAKVKRPKYIIPFKKTKQDCENIYSKMMKKAFFAPAELRGEDAMSRFRSIYMPYWVYKYEKNGEVRFKGSKSRREGDYIIYSNYEFRTELDAVCDGIVYDAAASFLDDLSSAITPFEWDDVMEFTPSFLSGFYADTQSVESSVYEEIGAEIVKSDFAGKLLKDNVCQKYTMEKDFIDKMKPDKVESELAMLPVWFMAHRKNDRVSYAAVNGQTGEVACDMPIDVIKFFIMSLVLAIPLFLGLNLFTSMRASTMLLIAAILAGVCCVISVKQNAELWIKTTEIDDLGKQSLKGKDISKKDDYDVWDRKRVTLAQHPIVLKIQKIILVFIAVAFVGTIIVSDNNSMYAMYGLLLVMGLFGVLALTSYCAQEGQKLIDKYNFNIKECMKKAVRPVMGIVLALVILILNPVSDLIYYAAALIIVVLIGLDLNEIIHNYNILATRELPQFNKRGGDEREW